ncbi:hypothetical protein H0274_00905 [Altererythrobacter sp. CC-YST694]|uniref:hypothetical protein n=1 Tax=Altererythrobacter sp. CC-YST694 TaxID=2755038 RepID=UPI001D025D48|nr:hypothetical protein [Altererythrobacter sp. CC-YST694]MCB5423800.1 hypothetical protein [Altererythrobacter sp. CC-YST694]
MVRTSNRLKTGAALAALVAFGTLLAPAQASAAECDRKCLEGTVTAYLDALLAHDPARLQLAGKARFTEDGKELKLGEGLWQTVSGKASFRQDYLDPQKQIAATHVELREGTIPVLYSAVLHLEGGLIAGIETLVQRIQPDSRFQPTELGAPIKGMNNPVPAEKRQSRATMIATALRYTEGLRIGNFTDAGTRFADGTYRVENGVITAGDGCGRDDCGMYSQRLMLHPAIIPSVAAVDEENGTVLLWMNFGDTGSYGPGNALVTFEGFKVWGGEIRAINAFFGFLPASTSRFWPSSDPVRP